MPDVAFNLSWDQAGQRFFETGVDRGVLYPFKKTNAQATAATYQAGVAWNGLTAVNENPSGAEATPLYADNIKYLNLMSEEQFGATIEAYTTPDEFAECDGRKAIGVGVVATQQARIPFGFSYRTRIGNDEDGSDHGYKIHLVYGAMASPSQINRSTINESPEAATLSYEITTTPVPVTGGKPTAHIIIDSTKADATKLAAFEQTLYGTPATGNDPAVPAALPLPDAVALAFAAG